jgi:hypothetical protein
VNLADMWVIERSNRTSFPLESCGVLRFKVLDRDDAIESLIAGLPDFAHSAATERRDNLVRAKALAWFQGDHD